MTAAVVPHDVQRAAAKNAELQLRTEEGIRFSSVRKPEAMLRAFLFVLHRRQLTLMTISVRKGAMVQTDY
jgi:hypothetical protein